MTRTRLALVTLAGAAVAFAAGAGAPSRPGPDTKALANTLVTTCANIHENDIVMVEGGVKDQELLENIAATVSKAGGYPLLTYGSDRLSRLTYDWTPEKYDTRTDTLGLKMAGLCNAMIMVEFNENPALMADVPPARAAARAKAGMAVEQAMLKNNVRVVVLGNDLYPTDARAKQFGISKDKLAEIFWAGVNTDMTNLQSTGEKLKQTLSSGNTVTITNPNGTNLTLKINGRTPFVSDGVISAEDAKKGGPACQVWLPAGEVYQTAVPGSAEGTAVIDRLEFQGKTITGLTLTFKKGKLTEMTAKSGLEPLQARYDAAGAGKDAFGFFDIGINPDVKIPAGSTLATWVPAGMISIGIGGDTWAGGTNECPFGITGHIPGSTLKVDDKAIINAGTLNP